MPRGEYLQYGGQAIIEGVMMRSPRYFAVACRAPNGEIVLDTEHLEKTWIGRQKWLKLPFLRGSWALLDAMALGVKAMKFAADVQMNPKYQKPDEKAEVPVPKPLWLKVLIGIASLIVGVFLVASAVASFGPLAPLAAEKRGIQLALLLGGVVFAWGGAVGLYNAATGKEVDSDRVQDYAVGATIVFSLAFGLFLFNYVPNALAEQLRFRGVSSGTVINFVVEMVKVVFFLLYILAIGQMNEIKEVFKYHGAEHKAINTLEAEQPLEMEYCRKQTRLHPRCGTSFAIIVLIVSIVVSTLTPRYLVTGGEQGGNWLLDVSARVLLEIFVLLPIISGISYELIRFAGKFRNSAFVNTLFKPGLMSQYMTTREPRDDQIEVALAALKACIEQEETHEVREDVVENALESAPTPVTP